MSLHILVGYISLTELCGRILDKAFMFGPSKLIMPREYQAKH